MEQSCCEVLLSPGAAAESARHHLGIARGSLSVSTQHGHPSAPRRHRCGLQVLPQQAATCNNMHHATRRRRSAVTTSAKLERHCTITYKRAWPVAIAHLPRGGARLARVRVGSSAIAYQHAKYTVQHVTYTAQHADRTTCSRRRATTTCAMQHMQQATGNYNARDATHDKRHTNAGAQNPQRSQVNVCFNGPSVAALGGAPRRTSCAHAA
jgi:hypothetical protein